MNTRGRTFARGPRLMSSIALATVVVTAIASPAPASDARVEKLLCDFHNQYLAGHNYSEKIDFPRSPEYWLSWMSLAISVGQDVALVITAGQSEVAVKTLSVTGGAVTAANIAVSASHGRGRDAVKNAVVSTVVTKGMTKLVGEQVPFLRTGVSCAGVINADKADQDWVRQQIDQQHEIIQFAGESARLLSLVARELADVSSQQKREEYKHVLTVLVQRRAELAVYREMIWDKIGNLDYGKEIELSVSRILLPGLGTRFTANAQLSFLVRRFIAGNISEADFDQQIRRFILEKIRASRPPNVTIADREVDQIRGSIAMALNAIKKWREVLNRYNVSRAYGLAWAGDYRTLVGYLPGIQSSRRGTSQIGTVYQGLRTGRIYTTGGVSTLIIYDTSGSMSDKLTGTSQVKMDLARSAVHSMLSGLVPTEDEWALMVYRDKETPIAVDFTQDPGSLVPVVDGLKPRGNTPLARSLVNGMNYIDRRAACDMARIVLLSDGEDTVDGHDAALEAAEALSRRTTVTISGRSVIDALQSFWCGTAEAAPTGRKRIVFVVVTLGMSARSRSMARLREICDRAKGHLMSAQSLPQLRRSLQQAVRIRRPTSGNWRMLAPPPPQPKAYYPVSSTTEWHPPAMRLRAANPYVAVTWGLATLMALLAGLSVWLCVQIIRAPFAKLVISGGGWRSEIPLRRRRTRIGRGSRNDVVLGSLRISQVHAEILKGESGVSIRDLKSTNGTYVNGRRIELTTLHDGDTIRFGDIAAAIQAG